MRNAFLDINILPTHFKGRAIVSWQVLPKLKDAAFFIYRKWDGGAEWELLNTEPARGTAYVDKTFRINNKIQVPAYKILAFDSDGNEYESPEVALYSNADRRAYGVAQNIIRALYLQARQDGIPVLYYPAIKNGEMSSSLDDLTGQRDKAVCLDTTADTEDGEDASNDYGTYYENGYYRPFLTYVRLIGAKRVKENVLDEGLFNDAVQHAIFLAFPPVRSGDLVVDVATDRRWIVGDSIETQTVKSIIPVAYKTIITLQEHNDPCYAVPIPSNYSTLLKQLTWPTMVPTLQK